MIEGNIFLTFVTGGLVVVPGAALINVETGLVAYGNELDKDSYTMYNWIGFSISMMLSVSSVTNFGKIQSNLLGNLKNTFLKL